MPVQYVAEVQCRDALYEATLARREFTGLKFTVSRFGISWTKVPAWYQK
jgi:hypothetical protein